MAQHNETAPAFLSDAESIFSTSVSKPPVKCGIYFLISGRKIVYIGRAIDIDRRLIAHERRLDYDRWSWVPCPARGQERLEREYLDKFLPPLNRDYHTEVARRAAQPFIEGSDTTRPRLRGGRLTPKGCYWRADTLWARLTVNGVEHRQTLRTADPKEAMYRRQGWANRLTATAV